MNREPERVGNRFDESKGEEQGRMNQTALQRAAQRNQSGVTATGIPQPVDDTTEWQYDPPGTQTNDAQLSWASGDHFVSPAGPGDSAFTSELARVAGVGSIEKASESPNPAFSNVVPVADFAEGNWNMDQILGGKR